MSSPAAKAPGTAGAGVGDADRPVHVLLWILQLSLAVVFAIAGWTKLVEAGEPLKAAVPWIADVPAPLVKLIGLCEILGALGLVFPSLTRIRPHLTPVAASCLTTVMMLAIAFHLYRGDTVVVVVPAALALASAMVAYGRFRKVSITPREEPSGR
jgi:putative oxidoreductase